MMAAHERGVPNHKQAVLLTGGGPRSARGGGGGAVAHTARENARLPRKSAAPAPHRCNYGRISLSQDQWPNILSQIKSPDALVAKL